MDAIITFTTDFGLADAYVAAMKGVVLGINPRARLVDICQSIRPQDISQAAFVLSTACGFFPQRTIHVVVVDPGVGTERRAIVLRTPEADFVAPDNGVLTYIIEPYVSGKAVDGYQTLQGAEAFAITDSRFWRSPVSPTFHGRDIFAPVAAHLSLGTPPAEFGEPVSSLVVLPLPVPGRMPDGTLVGHIIHVDSFGNLITSIKSGDLPGEAGEITVEVGGEKIHGLSATYGSADGLLALIGSSERLEISLKNGDASAFLKVGIGEELKIKAGS